MNVCLEDKYFKVEHLTNNDDLSGFQLSKGKGLEIYLKESALFEEENNISRTYLVKYKRTGIIAAYFTLRTGLITISRGFLKGFDTYTGIELANFAVNDNYNENIEDIPKLGAYIFDSFIIPLVEEISKYVGAYVLYIFALPKDKLMAHYKTMGFTLTNERVERYIYRHVKPYYDKGCRFMFQRIN